MVERSSLLVLIVTTIAGGAAYAGDVTTIAGSAPGFGGDGGPATAGLLSTPRGLAIAPDGSIYIADSTNNRVRKVDPSGILSTVVGTGDPGDEGDGGLATAAHLGGIFSIAVDSNSLYVADIDFNRVRRVDLSSGIISNFAGQGIFGAGFAGDGGPATGAEINTPQGLAVNAAGEVFIADTDNCRVRKVDGAGNIHTVAGTGCSFAPPSGDGGLATAAHMTRPLRVSVDGAGNVYVLDGGPNTVRRIDGVTQVITTVAGGGSNIPGFGPATTMNLGFTSDLNANDAGEIYISNFSQVFKVDAAGGLSVFAGSSTVGDGGDGGPAINALFSDISGLATTSTGAILISDAGNGRIRSVAPPVIAAFDLIMTLTTTQAFLDLVNGIAGSVIMVNVAGRDFLIIPNMTNVGGNVSVTGNDQLLVVDLSALASVGGNITVSGDLAMTSLDISSLTTVGGNLTVAGDPVLNAISVSGVTSIVGDLTIVGTAATVVDVHSLVTVGGAVTVSDNTETNIVDLSSLTTSGGSVTVSNNTSTNVVDLGSLISATGDVIVVGNTATNVIDLSSLISTTGGVTVDGNTSTNVVDVGSLTTSGGPVIVSNNTSTNVVSLASLTSTGGSVVVTGNTSTNLVDLSSLQTVAGSVIVDSNGSATTVALGSLSSVSGSVTVNTTGTGTYSLGNATVGGDINVTSTGTTTVSGITAGGNTNLTNSTPDATMRLQISTASFATPVAFSFTRVDPAALPPEAGLAGDGGPATIDPVVAYQFLFTTPVLNRDASLSFDVRLSNLDAATQAQLLAALAAGTATMATKPDTPASAYQAFDLCSGSVVPTTGGCVSVALLDSSGVPTSGTPAVVRFSNIVGHFSTWAVAIVTPKAESGSGGGGSLDEFSLLALGLLGWRRWKISV